MLNILKADSLSLFFPFAIHIIQANSFGIFSEFFRLLFLLNWMNYDAWGWMGGSWCCRSFGGTSLLLKKYVQRSAWRRNNAFEQKPTHRAEALYLKCDTWFLFLIFINLFRALSPLHPVLSIRRLPLTHSVLSLSSSLFTAVLLKHFIPFPLIRRKKNLISSCSHSNHSFRNVEKCKIAKAYLHVEFFIVSTLFLYVLIQFRFHGILVVCQLARNLPFRARQTGKFP